MQAIITGRLIGATFVLALVILAGIAGMLAERGNVTAGHAHPAPRAMFNPSATLDTATVDDMRDRPSLACQFGFRVEPSTDAFTGDPVDILSCLPEDHGQTD